MAVRENGPLTEAMFYTLMAFLHQDVCGAEIAQRVEQKTAGRVKLGPGTLYTILGKFLEDAYIVETEVAGRQRTYHLTKAGRAIFQRELDRLRQCLSDGEAEL